MLLMENLEGIGMEHWTAWRRVDSSSMRAFSGCGWSGNSLRHLPLITARTRLRVDAKRRWPASYWRGYRPRGETPGAWPDLAKLDRTCPKRGSKHTREHPHDSEA